MVNTVSLLLVDDYRLLTRYLEGKVIKKIVACTEKNVAMLLEDGIIIHFLQLEDELIFDIELPAQA
ncbi:MAG: hypothetical protein PHT79_08665 [Syntrophomonadaceae bacterium]|nr:hypothetical protein [Syntrophomonadaceae bacterium]MDD3889193.1 hypothetical protein [Syntrophomonadaceae bacterium]MDD4549812.1 hypothetical protein [Syntrophomonadaceae bacterium]